MSTSRLEDQFPNAHQHLSCFLAWTEDAAKGLGTLADEQLGRAKRWATAHDQADQAVRAHGSANLTIKFFNCTLCVLDRGKRWRER